jgi:hypothetical protein
MSGSHILGFRPLALIVGQGRWDAAELFVITGIFVAQPLFIR